MLYWSKKTSLWVAFALTVAIFTSLPATAGTHSPAIDESEPAETEKRKKEPEKESEDELEAALKKSFSDSQLARIEKLKDTEKEALSKVALQLKAKKEKNSSKDWREDLPKEAELTEKELEEAKKFIEKEYHDDPENYELRQMSELLGEEEDRILAKKADEQKQKETVDEAWAGLSSLTKTTTENLTKLGNTIQEGWNKLSATEQTAATIGGAVALNTVVPGAGSLLLSGLGTTPKPSSQTSSQAPASNPPASGTHAGSTSGSSTASVPSTETSSSTPSSASTSTSSSSGAGTSSGSSTPSSSSTPIAATKPTPASTSTSPSTGSTSGTASTGNGLTSSAQTQSSTPTSAVGTTSLPSIASTPKPETPALTSNPVSQPPVENPVSTASTPSQQLPTFSPQTMDGILEKTKHFPTSSVSNLATGNFMGHEGKYGASGTSSNSNSTSSSNGNSPYSTAIGKSGSEDIFAERKSVAELGPQRTGKNRPESSPSLSNASPSGTPQTSNGSGENNGTDSTAATAARESNSDNANSTGNNAYAQYNGTSKKGFSPKDNSDWNFRSEDRGVSEGPVSRGNQLQWDENAQPMASSSSSGVERMKEVLGESTSYSKNAEYGAGLSDESYSDFARRISEESGGRGLADNEAAESALEKPGNSAKRMGAQSDAAEDESFVSLELGYNVEDVLSEVKKTIQSNGKPKKPSASQVMRSQFAYVNGSSKSDLTSFKESAIKPNF